MIPNDPEVQRQSEQVLGTVGAKRPGTVMDLANEDGTLKHPAPQVALDALAAACEAFGGDDPADVHDAQELEAAREDAGLPVESIEQQINRQGVSNTTLQTMRFAAEWLKRLCDWLRQDAKDATDPNHKERLMQLSNVAAYASIQWTGRAKSCARDGQLKATEATK